MNGTVMLLIWIVSALLWVVMIGHLIARHRYHVWKANERYKQGR